MYIYIFVHIYLRTLHESKQFGQSFRDRKHLNFRHTRPPGQGWMLVYKASAEGLQGSLNYPFWGNPIMQTYGNAEGFPLP